MNHCPYATVLQNQPLRTIIKTIYVWLEFLEENIALS